MYFPVNYGAETSIIYYIGLYGEYSVVSHSPSRHNGQGKKT